MEVFLSRGRYEAEEVKQRSKPDKERNGKIGKPSTS